MDEPGRNDVFDRELRRALAADGGAAAGPHVDAELAAAWIDRRLEPAAALAVEAHVAGCHDCQFLMATLARMAAETPAAEERVGWWQRLRAGWVVPAAVATAAALVIWVALPQQRTAPPAPASLQAPDNRVAAPAPPAETALEADRTANESARLVEEPQRKQAAVVEQAPQSSLVPAPAPAPEGAPSLAAPPPPLAAPAAPPAPQLERRERSADVSADARANPNAKAEALESPAAAPALAERQDAANATQALRDGRGGGVVGFLASGSLTITAGDGAARWRRMGPAIEFAPRPDAPFVAATLPVAAATVTAGASPGGTVCWLVGTGGLVLITTDGVRFARTAPPAPIDLAAVAATDARTATVTATNGRRFRTTDAGASWSAVP